MAPLSDADLAALAAELAREPRARVLIDGPSGAGKTTLAQRLRAAWPGPIQLVSLDDVYPGWGGLAAGSDAVPGLLDGSAPGYRRWEWQRGRPGGWVALEARLPVIVEGCGALTPASRARASYGIWVDADAAARRARALRREPRFAEQWEAWAAQERAHCAAHRPWELADLRLGDPA